MKEAEECAQFIENTFAEPPMARIAGRAWNEEAKNLILSGSFDFQPHMLVWYAQPNPDGSITVSGRSDVIRALEDLLLDERIEFKRLTEDGVILIASQ